MGKWWYVLIGAAASGPVWIVATYYAARRIFRGARRIAARARGREHFAEIGRLTAGLAHEIKNPLSTIHVNLRLLAEDLARHDDELHRRWLRRLDSARNEAARVRDILDDFLRYAGHYELNPQRTNLRALLQELLDFFEPQAAAAHVVLRTSFPDSPLEASVDAKLLKQALLNLLINATQAMESGGELLVKLSAARSQAVIEIIDTGPGMAPEVLGRVFDAYFSTKKSGSGLGLPTTRRIVAEHNGTIRAESEPGKGTRFIVTLPLA